MITKEYLTKLLSSLNIISVFRSFLKLEKRGNGFFAICPFHTEKTASFYININKGRYYCFGCHKSGDLIQFVMLYKNLNFANAVQYLSGDNDFKKYQNNLFEIKHQKNIE